jgi:hypothetical protein
MVIACYESLLTCAFNPQPHTALFDDYVQSFETVSRVTESLVSAKAGSVLPYMIAVITPILSFMKSMDGFKATFRGRVKHLIGSLEKHITTKDGRFW